MNKDAYITEVSHRLHIRFSQLKEGARLPEANRYRLEGFMQAGTFIGLTTNAELSALIEQIHLAVFGQTVAERKKAQGEKWPDESIDYTFYDSPAYERR